MSKTKHNKKNTELFREHKIDAINKSLFYKEYGFIENVASVYLNQCEILEYINKNNLNEFKDFFKENKRETIEHLLFDKGLINSDSLVTELNIRDAVTKNEEKGYKYLESESVFEVAKVLTKNKEFELLSGSCNPKISSTIYDIKDLSLPFQIPKGGISNYSHSFKFNYTIDRAKHQKTKDELKKIRNKRIKDLFFNLGLEDTRWIYSFLDIYNKHEIILRRNEIRGDNLLKKIDDFDFMRKNFNKDLKKLERSLYRVQFDQQGKVLEFIKKNPTPYLMLIEDLSNQDLSNQIKEDNKPYVSTYEDDSWTGFGFSGSNGGPIGKLEKISNREYSNLRLK